MGFPKPKPLQNAISVLCLSIIAMNILLYIFWEYIETDTEKWMFQMISILMGIYGIVIIYQRRKPFLIFFFYTMLFNIVLIIGWTTYDFYKQIISVTERMNLKLEEIRGTDEMYVAQKKLSCCEEDDVTEDKLNSLTGSCCGKENNEVCSSINDVFRVQCLPLMIADRKKNLYIRVSLDIGLTLLLLITSLLFILLNVSIKRYTNRDRKDSDQEDGIEEGQEEEEEEQEEEEHIESDEEVEKYDE